ncbi:hypothetical protein [Polyangium sp. 6x1]|uniref:hypothetical protein n=1 Tax=Polyangium sp. 6x1 TaxID=3042689 RepID=UPI002482F81D|nr:hypothetical protein [Polyangium sp. 6x1]MDI1450426.1 hypothetical protein [Polyangium sp. 6x1]
MDDVEDLGLEFISEADDALEEKGATTAPTGGAEPEEESAEGAAAEDPEIPEEEAAAGESPEKPAMQMGMRLVARSAEGTVLVNSLEVLPQFEPSI